MNVEEAVKLVVSAGIVTPPFRSQPTTQAARLTEKNNASKKLVTKKQAMKKAAGKKTVAKKAVAKKNGAKSKQA